MRTAIYVDGFNLFHRLLEGKANVKWLDLFALARACLRNENDVTMIRYFTARVTGTETDPDQPSRQDVYLRALLARGVHVHYGTFRQRQKRARLVEPSDNGESTHVRIWTREEKDSDVNLGVHMLHDAWNDEYDCAVVLSNDSDLAEALRLVRSLGKVVGILCPVAGGPAKDLQMHADFVRPIRLVHLLRSQFPIAIRLPGGSEVRCPSRWYSSRAAQARLKGDRVPTSSRARG
ncbi:MAG: NYN domain-containing protein [Luteibacter sp.]|uniref:NYN domain-containing protein n=1 Tax=Luteibacter sp. TaxID=1886636 RepID=UPI002807001D|nr:NYN domain-containing protein [Luteibacter sp.]MDQ7994663.1 NYN domain-containing protein [Luteibacter sp.]MDQ8048236.1 NYN domain-containing protein [Luteibacter sp.]